MFWIITFSSIFSFFFLQWHLPALWDEMFYKFLLWKGDFFVLSNWLINSFYYSHHAFYCCQIINFLKVQKMVRKWWFWEWETITLSRCWWPTSGLFSDTDFSQEQVLSWLHLGLIQGVVSTSLTLWQFPRFVSWKSRDRWK